MVTAFTTVEPVRLARCSRLLVSASAEGPPECFSFTTIRCMMLVDLVRELDGAKSGLDTEVGECMMPPCVVHLRCNCAFSSSARGVSSPSSGTIRIVLSGLSMGLSIDFFSSRLSRRTSTLLLKYASMQSSSFIPFPSVSDGIGRLRHLSWTTLWSSTSPFPWWKRSIWRARRGNCRSSAIKAKASDVSCCSRSAASFHPHSAKASCICSVCKIPVSVRRFGMDGVIEPYRCESAFRP